MNKPGHNRPRVVIAWSSGKDSAWALQVLRETDEVKVVGLLTTFNEAFDRVAMHAVRRELVEVQARAAGLPLINVPLPWPCSNAAYEEAMGRALTEVRTQLQITHVAFGDLFLEDVRQYRESRMQGTGLTPLFPLWGRPTRTLAHEMVSAGLTARITCVDPKRLPPSYAGRVFDGSLLDALPDEVDACGERGEFHTFVCEGPMFARPIPVSLGEVVARDGFIFADLLPGTDGDEAGGRL